MLAAMCQADAFALPFHDGTFDVIVADPPYRGRNRGKKGIGYAEVGYIPFAGRGWWAEAMRVLRPSGHLYVFAAVRELWDWAAAVPEPPQDILAWLAPNNPSIMAFWRRGIRGRAPAWRPVLQWQKAPARPITWGRRDEWVHAITGRPLRGEPTSGYVDPNVQITWDWPPQNCASVAAVQTNMHESLPWPNQLPERLLRYLLHPHRGARVLDVFAGTGTCRAVCAGLGLDVVSVDLSPEAVALTARRPAQLGSGL